MENSLELETSNDLLLKAETEEDLLCASCVSNTSYFTRTLALPGKGGINPTVCVTLLSGLMDIL